MAKRLALIFAVAASLFAGASSVDALAPAQAAVCMPEPVWGCLWLGTEYRYCWFTIIGWYNPCG